ncbi:MAG: carbohydrate-binding family 9-like protein [Fimbriimonadaceae bacterium]|nr:carbohydrate-binding family 9-like protein [Fimbriimonadaceae bacterium]
MTEPSSRWAHPKGYVCLRAPGPPTIDGRLDKPFWAHAAWTDAFVDIEGDAQPAPRHRTRAKMLWDERFFYIGAELEEPHVWGTLTEHDSVIFQDNDFEVFLDPDGDNHRYYEIEINALGTVWDLLLARPYRNGGPAINAWEIPGLQSAVDVDGTLNDPSDEDRGWSVELALPWKVLGECAGRPSPPKDGDRWRINFSRVEWRHTVVDGRYGKVLGLKEDNWVWSPQWAVDMHRPEHWGYVQFSTRVEDAPAFVEDPAWAVIALLHRVYHAQQAFRGEHGSWARKLAELGIESVHGLDMAASDLQFVAWAEAEGAGRCTIDHESCLRRTKLP